MSDFDLKKLADPFPAGDIEFRVQSAWPSDGKVSCLVIPYITSRAIETRLDDICGPENWCSTKMECHEVRVGVIAVQVGISIMVGDGLWVTKYDVSEAPERRETVKGAYTFAFKRAGYKWGLGRYLKHLDAMFAETSKTGVKGWEWAELNQKHGGKEYYWRSPTLPAWALPQEAEKPIPADVINRLKTDWRNKFAATEKNRQVLATGFQTFVHSIVGEFPSDEVSCWTQQIVDDVRKRIEMTTDGKGPSADVPFV